MCFSSLRRLWTDIVCASHVDEVASHGRMWKSEDDGYRCTGKGSEAHAAFFYDCHPTLSAKASAAWVKQGLFGCFSSRWFFRFVGKPAEMKLVTSRRWPSCASSAGPEKRELPRSRCGDGLATPEATSIQATVASLSLSYFLHSQEGPHFSHLQSLPQHLPSAHLQSLHSHLGEQQHCLESFDPPHVCANEATGAAIRVMAANAIARFFNIAVTPSISWVLLL